LAYSLTLNDSVVIIVCIVIAGIIYSKEAA